MRNPEREHVKTPDRVTGRTVTTQHRTVTEEGKKESAEKKPLNSAVAHTITTDVEKTVRMLQLSAGLCCTHSVHTQTRLFLPTCTGCSVQAQGTYQLMNWAVPVFRDFLASRVRHQAIVREALFLLEVKTLVQNPRCRCSFCIHRNLHLVRAHYSQPRFHTASVHMRLQHKRSLNSPSGPSQSA